MSTPSLTPSSLTPSSLTPSPSPPPSLTPFPSHFISFYPIEGPFSLGFNFYQLQLQLSVRMCEGVKVHVWV